jgi:hypothetical protein
MKEEFTPWRPSARSMELIDIINDILEDYRSQGYKLTLRQLYYQLVAGDHIPNNQREYKKIGNVVNKGRLAGFIDWNMIEDRVRNPKENTHWRNPKHILDAAVNGYYESRWKYQNEYVEVWCEKDAVSNIIQPVCSKWDVIFMANRGYSSQSALYEAGKRFEAAHFEGKYLHLIYLGDHDPSGMDMTRDVEDRMNLFLGYREEAEEDIPIVVDRIALNMPQIKLYNPPENPAKQTDSRFEVYADQYGDASWELDALQPSVLEQVVDDAVEAHVDHALWDKAVDLEAASKQTLQNIADNL